MEPTFSLELTYSEANLLAAFLCRQSAAMCEQIILNGDDGLGEGAKFLGDIGHRLTVLTATPEELEEMAAALDRGEWGPV